MKRVPEPGAVRHVLQLLADRASSLVGAVDRVGEWVACAVQPVSLLHPFDRRVSHVESSGGKTCTGKATNRMAT